MGSPELVAHVQKHRFRSKILEKPQERVDESKGTGRNGFARPGRLALVTGSAACRWGRRSRGAGTLHHKGARTGSSGRNRPTTFSTPRREGSPSAAEWLAPFERSFGSSAWPGLVVFFGGARSSPRQRTRTRSHDQIS